MTKLEQLMLKDFERHLIKVEKNLVRHCEGCGYLLDTTEEHVKLCIYCWNGGNKKETFYASQSV